MKSPRKIITRVFVFLLLIVGGAIVNVAVAWGLAYGVDDWRSDAGLFELEIALARTPHSRWEPREELPDGTWVMVHHSGVTEEPQSQQSDRWWHVLTVRPTTASTQTTLKVGWPARALEAQIEGGAQSLLRSSEALLSKPVWPGFAINTLFYAVILWVLFAAPFALRRRRRIKRGLCPACAYPVGDSEVCTECGKPVGGPSVESDTS